MRKITEQSVNAFIARRAMTSGNMTVRNVGNETHMLLHGNMIARLCAPIKSEALELDIPAQIMISDCDWRTTTTKERLNGLLSTFPLRYSIYQKDHTWYLSTPTGDAVWKGGAVFTAAGEFTHMTDVAGGY